MKRGAKETAPEEREAIKLANALAAGARGQGGGGQGATYCILHIAHVERRGQLATSAGAY